jgi:phosphoribosylaminoimidazole (AIR) synthetase
MADTGMSYAGAGVDIGGGNQMVQLIELLLRSATRAGAVGVAGPWDLYR